MQIPTDPHHTRYVIKISSNEDVRKMFDDKLYRTINTKPHNWYILDSIPLIFGLIDNQILRMTQTKIL